MTRLSYCLSVLSPFLLAITITHAADGYTKPSDNGGSMLTTVLSQTFPDGQQEPINTIISGTSDPDVLVNSRERGGLLNYFLSLSFTTPCFGKLDVNSVQQANLGDGNGLHNQTQIMRYDYGDPAFGACKESVEGGNHFRYWIQNGTDANTSAVFMAVSYELPAKLGHDIVPNGYNIGRDLIVGNITGSAIVTLSISSDGSSYSGKTSSEGYTYATTITYVSDLLQNTSVGINHNETVSLGGISNAVDGLVAVYEVSILERPESEDSDESDSAQGLVALTPLVCLGSVLLPILVMTWA